MLSTRLPATVTIVLLLVVAARAQQPTGLPSEASAIDSAVERTAGTMIGAVLRGGDPVSRAPVRLRD